MKMYVEKKLFAMRKSSVFLAMAIFLQGIAGSAQGAAIEGTIINMATTSEIEILATGPHTKFGGCIVKMTTDNASAQNPAQQDSGCGNQWLSADCSNDFITSKGLQSKMFDTINLAYVSNTTVRLNFRSDWKHNNFCVITSAELK